MFGFKLPENKETQKHIYAICILIAIAIFIGFIVAWPPLILIIAILMILGGIYAFIYWFVEEVFFDD